jgi:hypothetical protein
MVTTKKAAGLRPKLCFAQIVVFSYETKIFKIVTHLSLFTTSLYKIACMSAFHDPKGVQTDPKLYIL